MPGEPVSPELALVDPELAARARLSLPAPGTFGRSPPAAPVPQPVPLRQRDVRLWPRLARGAILLVLCASLVLNVDLLTEHAPAPARSAGRSTPPPPRQQTP